MIPVLNEGRFIGDTARRMLEQRFAGTIEFIFVDGNSADDTRLRLEELAEADPRVRVLENPREKTPIALNIALRAARGEFVARMDAHAWYPPRYLADGVARLRRGDADWVAGPAIPRGTGRWSTLAAAALSSPIGRGGSKKWSADGSGLNEEIELDTGVFAGVWRRDVIDAYGGWAEEWHQNQDSELAARFLADGKRIVCLASMGAEYAPRNTLRGLARQYYRFGWYRARTAKRHPSTLRTQHLVSPALALAAPASFLPIAWLAQAARMGMACYSALLAFASWRTARDSRLGDEAVLLPLVFAALHFGWGAGFVAASARKGVPFAALRHAVLRPIRSAWPR